MSRISGERLRQAREVAGLTQTELAEIVRVDQSFVSLAEQNSRAPSEGNLEAIALATGFPVAFFRQPPSAGFPLGSLLYRKKRGLPSADVERFRQTGQLVYQLIADLQKRFNPLPVTIPLIADEDPETAAQAARSALGMAPTGPVKGLVGRLERAGVYVFRLPLETEFCDAFSSWTDDERPVVALGSLSSWCRQRFTLAHELAHLVLHRVFLHSASLREIEKEADRFAYEFLFPEVDARVELTPPLTLTRLAELKARWGISMQAIADCSFRLGLISERQKRYIRSQLHSKGWLETEPGDSAEPESPKLLLKMASAAFGSPLAAGNMAKTFCLSPRWLERILQANQPSLASRSRAGDLSPGSQVHSMVRPEASSPRRSLGSHTFEQS